MTSPEFLLHLSSLVERAHKGEQEAMDEIAGLNSEHVFLEFCAEREYPWAVYQNAVGTVTASLWPHVGEGFTLDIAEDDWNKPLASGTDKIPSAARKRAMDTLLRVKEEG